MNGGVPSPGARKWTATFAPFRLDTAAGLLFEGERSVALRRRTWDVLCHLVARAGELVSKAELLAAVWQDAVVTDLTLSTSITELRRALGDDPRSPRFIETVHGRGFRFIAPVALESRAKEPPPVGRHQELAELLRWWAEAADGRRRIVFVTGEAGMGKTTLLRSFVDRLGVQARAAIAPCIEQHGEGEAFMPVIDAVRQLCSGEAGAAVAGRVRANAPAWLAEMLGAAAREAAPAPSAPKPATRAATLRCLAETLEAVASDAPLLLALEDVHWSDASTLDLLNLLGRRAQPARLLVLATLRAADAEAARHPVVEVLRNLSRRPGCGVIELEGLAGKDGAALLESALGGGPASTDLTARMIESSGGNPFLLRELATHLVDSGSLVEGEDGHWSWRDPGAAVPLPDSAFAAIEPRIARLEAGEQRALEAAALIGPRFSPAIVAQALGGEADAEAVDECFSRLAARRELVAHGEGEDYRFLHALNEASLRRRIAPARRRRLHEQIARALERAGGATPALLADHYARAGAGERALHWYEQAVQVAKQRSADREVALLCRAALAQLAALEAGRDRSKRELRLQFELGLATLATRGYSAPEQAATFGRVCELAEELHQPAVRYLGTGGLFFHHLSSGNIPAGMRQAERMLEQAAGLPPALAHNARTAMGVARFNAGDFAGAVAYLEPDGADASAQGGAQMEILIFRLAALSKTYAILGRLDRARATIEETVARGASGGRPFDLANAHRGAAELHAVLGDVAASRRHARQALALSDEHGFAQLAAIARLFDGWAAAHASEAAAGLRQIGEAFAALEPTGYRLLTSGFRLRQAEAARLAGDPEAGARAVVAGLAYVAESGERRHQSDLLRLEGLCRLDGRARGAEAEAERSFAAACRVAQEQGAVLHQLRARVEWAALAGSGEPVAALRQLLSQFPDSLPVPELARAQRAAA